VDGKQELFSQNHWRFQSTIVAFSNVNIEPIALDFERAAPARRLVSDDLLPDAMQHFVAAAERQPSLPFPIFDARNVNRSETIAATEFVIHRKTGFRASVMNVPTAPIGGIGDFYLAGLWPLKKPAKQPVEQITDCHFF
jgi:hypothetical protein